MSGQYSTVQYSTVQYSTVQYSTVQYSTGKYSTVLYSTVQHSTVQYSTVQHSTVQGTIVSAYMTDMRQFFKCRLFSQQKNWPLERHLSHVCHCRCQTADIVTINSFHAAHFWNSLVYTASLSPVRSTVRTGDIQGVCQQPFPHHISGICAQKVKKKMLLEFCLCSCQQMEDENK